MSRVDWRRLLDVGSEGAESQGFVTLEVQDDARLRLGVQVERRAEPGQQLPPPAAVLLDYHDAGLLLDWLREALGVQLLLKGDPVAGAAVAGLDAAQRGAQSLSDGSATIRDRG